MSTDSIQIPSGFDITTFLPDPERGIFFLGSRQGALACYDLSSAKLVGLWRRIHDQEGVRSIKLHHSNKVSSSYAEIVTAGRNCAYRIIGVAVPKAFNEYLAADIISGSVEGALLHPVHKNILNRGWLEGVWNLVYAADGSLRRSSQIFSSGDSTPIASICGMRRPENSFLSMIQGARIEFGTFTFPRRLRRGRRIALHLKHGLCTAVNRWYDLTRLLLTVVAFP